jgi:hypothetical protein
MTDRQQAAIAQAVGRANQSRQARSYLNRKKKQKLFYNSIPEAEAAWKAEREAERQEMARMDLNNNF